MSDILAAFVKNFSSSDLHFNAACAVETYEKQLKSKVIDKEKEERKKMRDDAKSDRENMEGKWTAADEDRYAWTVADDHAYEFEPFEMAWHMNAYPTKEFMHVRTIFFAEQSMSVLQRKRLHTVDEKDSSDIDSTATRTILLLAHLVQSEENALNKASKKS